MESRRSAHAQAGGAYGIVCNGCKHGRGRKAGRLVDQLNTIIGAKRRRCADCVACLLAGGHLLMEDVPGVGKHRRWRMRCRRRSGCDFSARAVHRRPDAGRPVGSVACSTVARRFFRFIRAVFAQVLLADEINRAGLAKTLERVLLEAMEEKQVSIDNETAQAASSPASLPYPATSDHPLLELQLDRS